MPSEEKDWSRLRIVNIPYKMLTKMFSNQGQFPPNWTITHVDGLPQDAQIVGHAEDFASQAIRLKVWSSEFSLVPEGNMIPPLELRMRTSELL